MVCRNAERAQAAQDEIRSASQNEKVFTLIGDCALQADVTRVVAEFGERETQLHCVVCNAGALTNTRMLTAEGSETTFAAHLLVGTWLLLKLTLPMLKRTPESRAVVVSSGGMLNVKFPKWEIATAQVGKYDGQLAYAYAKRGQVLLCEELAKQHADVPFVSCHPGWCDTPGVTAAYGSSKKWLEPLRTLWQGAEGIIWLCTRPRAELVSGAFYLDRQPEAKHIEAGGLSRMLMSDTTNSVEEVRHMMAKLEEATTPR